jgi:hypothetical protein
MTIYRHMVIDESSLSVDGGGQELPLTTRYTSQRL